MTWIFKPEQLNMADVVDANCEELEQCCACAICPIPRDFMCPSQSQTE